MMLRSYIRLGTIQNIYNRYGICRAQVTILETDAPEDVVLLHPYGINGYPPIGSMCVIYSIYLYSETKYAIPFNPDFAPKLQPGEVIIYNNKNSKIHLKEDGSIEIESASNDINITSVNANITTTGAATINSQTSASITAPAINLNGNVIISGTLSSAAATMTTALIGGKDFATHSHSGVTSGGSNTGPVV